MRIPLPLRPFVRRIRPICASLVLLFCGAFIPAYAATGPTILTEPSSTRAIAFESVTFRKEPFSPTMSPAFSTDTRNRIVFFVMNLDLLAGEGANALTAEAEDSQKRIYTFKVESVAPVPGYTWMSQIIVRLSDDIGDV